MVDGHKTYPMVPVAVGAFSIFFNIFNVLILFPFIGTFEKYLSRIGAKTEEAEDFSHPRYLDDAVRDDFSRAVPAVQAEIHRQLIAGALFLDIARGRPEAPKEPAEHADATDSLSREIRAYSAHLFHDDLDREQMDLVASLIEEVDFTGALTEQLHQIARRTRREQFSPASQVFLEEALERLDRSMDTIVVPQANQPSNLPPGHDRTATIDELRWKVIDTASLPAGEKGALVALLGSIERSEDLIGRIKQERASVDRGIATFEKA
ncbi:hypothetical protein [Luteococcus peritonei]|uniref:Uncharacterized protein n=1 Tax=Luteococcus peritonei TaxID=88874 RepID=A0ABW4RXV0_9ACTN